LVITTLPLLEVVMRTGRATRPETVLDEVSADDDDCETVDGNGMRCGATTFAVALRVMVPVVVAAGVVTRFDVAAVLVPTLPTGGFDAAVGDGVRLDETVGVKSPVL